LNEEILRLVAVGDFAHALKAIDEFKKFAITNISSVNREYAKFSSKIGNSLNKLEAAFERLATVTKREDLISGLRGLGARISNIARRYAQDIGTLYEGLVSELDKTHNKIKVMAMGTPRFIGRGLPGAGATIRGSGEALVAKYGTREINKLQSEINRLFTRMSKGLIPVEEFASKVQQIRIRMAGVVDKTAQLKQILSVLSEKEQSLTATMNTRVALGDMLVKRYSKSTAHHKDLVNIAGVLIDKNNQYYKVLSNVQSKVAELKQQEKEIIQLYDREIRYAKEGLAILIREGRPLTEIAAQTRNILNLETRRNKELDKLRKQAIEINRRLSSDPYAKVLEEMKQKETEIVRARRIREKLADILVSKEKNLISVAGVAVDLRSELLRKVKSVRIAIDDLIQAEKLINSYYDQEVARKREALNVLIKQKAPVEDIELASKEILQLEKLREKELTKIARYMTQINKLLSGQASGAEARKVADQLRRLAGEAVKAAKATSTLGLSNKELSSDIVRLGGATTGLFRVFSRWRNRLLVLSFAFAGLIRNIQQYIELSAEAQKRSISLMIIAENFGLSLEKVREAVNKLMADGLVSLPTITQAMKNLLSMGASLDNVVALIDAMKDSILANGKATLSMAEAIETGTQGIKEMRSQTSDNIGVMDNINTLLKEYAGLVKEVGVANALLIAFTEKARQFEGMRAKMLKTLSGQLAILKTRTYELKVAIGEALAPVMENLVEMYMKFVDETKRTFTENKSIIKVYADVVGKTIADLFRMLIGLGKVLSEFAKTFAIPLISAFSGLVKILVNVKIGGASLGAKLLQLTVVFRAAAAVVRAYNKSLEKGILHQIRLRMEAKKTSSVMKGISAGIGKQLLQLGAWSAVLTAITAIFNIISKIIEHQKKLVALEQKRLDIAKKLRYHYSTIKDVISLTVEALKEANQVGAPDLGEYFMLADMVEKMNPLERMFSESIISRYEELNSKVGESVKRLREMGIEITKNGKIVVRSLKTGKELFRGSVAELQTLQEVLAIVNESSGVIPQIAEDTRKFLAEAREDIEELRVELETAGFTDFAKSLADVYTKYKENLIEINRHHLSLTTRLDAAQKKSAEYLQALTELGGNYKEIIKGISKALNNVNTEAGEYDEKLKEFLKDTTWTARWIGKGITEEQVDLVKSYVKALLKALDTIKDVKKGLSTIEELKQLRMDIMFKEWAAAAEKYGEQITKLTQKIQNMLNKTKESTEANQRLLELTYNEDTARYIEIIRKIEEKRNSLTVEHNSLLAEVQTKINEIETDLTSMNALMGLIDEDTKEYQNLLKISKDLHAQLTELKNKENDLSTKGNELIDSEIEKLKQNYYLQLQITSELRKQKELMSLMEQLEDKMPEIQLQRWKTTLEGLLALKDVEGKKEALYNFFVTGLGLPYEKVDEKLKNELERGANDLFNSYAEAFMKASRKSRFSKGLLGLVGGVLEGAGISGAEGILKNLYPFIEMRQKYKELLKQGLIDQEQYNQVAELTERKMWETLSQIAEQGVTAYLNIISRMDEAKEQFIAQRVALKKQYELGMIDQETYLRKMQALQVQHEAWERVYWLRMKQQIAQQIASILAIRAVEWAFNAAEAALKGPAFWPEAAGWAAMAIMAGLGSHPMLNLARSFGLKAAKIEATAEVRAQAIEQGYIGATTTQGNIAYNPMGSYVPGVNTTTNLPNYGVTLTNPATAPTVNISLNLNADTMLMGSDIEEAGEMLGRKIVSVVNEAIETGEVQLSR